MKPKFNGACVLSTGVDDIPIFILERCWDLIEFVPVGQETNSVVTTAAAIALGRATGRVIIARKGVLVIASEDLTVYPCGKQLDTLAKAYFQANSCLGKREVLVRPDTSDTSVRAAPASAVVADGTRRSTRGSASTAATSPATSQPGNRRSR